MKRLTRKREGSRDEIRFRLHMSIQAASYLADDPDREDVDRELKKIMTAGGPGTPQRSGRELTKAWYLIMIMVPVVVITVMAGLFGPGHVAAVVLKTVPMAVPALLAVLRMAPFAFGHRRESSVLWPRGGSLRVPGGERPEGVGRVTGSQQ